MYRIVNLLDSSSLKFITPNCPEGLWTGRKSGKTFDTLEEAGDYMHVLRLALAAKLAKDIEDMRESSWTASYRVKRIRRMVEDHLEYINNVKVEFSTT